MLKHEDPSSHPSVQVKSPSRLHMPISSELGEVETPGLVELAGCQPSPRFSEKLYLKDTR